MKHLMNLISVAGLAGCLVYIIILWRNCILTDSEKLTEYITEIGNLGVFVFMLVQIIQVVIPIIPGGVSCAVGVMIFGPWYGFLYNYISICTGSVIVFLISKKFGDSVMHRLFDERLIEKYKNWTDTGDRFAKLFAAAIFFPVSPDDFLCYLAGTTNMKLRTFLLIIFLGKPLSIAIYSMGLNEIIQHLISQL